MSGHRFIIATLVMAFLLIVMPSCSHEGEELVPSIGVATYEVTYSKDLRDNSTFGTFLPHSVTCLYDSCHAKLTAAAPLGLAKIGIVIGASENFATVDFDNAKLLLSLNDMLGLGTEDGDGAGVEVKEAGELTDISGFMSAHLTIEPRSTDQASGSIDIFYIPFGTEKSTGALRPVDLGEKSGGLRLPGLVTAMNVKLGESNVMLLIKDVKRQDHADSREFERPRGFIEASRRDIVAMCDLLLN